MCPPLSLFRREENRDGDTYVPYALHSYRSTATPFICPADLLSHMFVVTSLYPATQPRHLEVHIYIEHTRVYYWATCSESFTPVITQLCAASAVK